MSAQDAPTTELVAGAVGDRCANCNAPLASDQRYCVNCGDRRGKARFGVGAQAASGAAAAHTGSDAGTHEAHHRAPPSAGITLVAAVATLLIAMGVGVLIGRSSNSGPARASQPVQVITVGGGGTSAGAATTANAAGTAASTHTGKTKSAKTIVVHINAKVTKAATQAASHVFGNSGNLSNNVTQQQGGACSGGAGCQGGHFTGNFFGP